MRVAAAQVALRRMAVDLLSVEQVAAAQVALRCAGATSPIYIAGSRRTGGFETRKDGGMTQEEREHSRLLGHYRAESWQRSDGS